jgi:hypothetical protein
MASVNLPDGRKINFPDGTPETEMSAAVQTLLSSGPSIDKQIDRKTGAPVAVREAVGNAPVQDRLGTIRRYYPDAVPYEGDNFVFRDPENNRLKLYNEDNPHLLGIPLPTPGDIASVGREIAVGAGGTLGGMAAAVGALPTAGLGAAAGPVMVGAGAATGGALYDAMRGLRGMPDSRTLPERLAGTATDFAGNAVGQKVAEAVPGMVKAAIKGSVNRLAGVDPTQLADDFSRLGVQPTAGQVTGNRILQGTEQAASRLPTGAQTMYLAAKQQIDTLGTKLEDLASGAGAGRSDADAGRALQRGVQGFTDRFKETAGKLYDAVDDFVAPDTKIAYKNIKSTLQGQAAEFAETPRLGQIVQAPQARAYLSALEGDARDVFIANYRGPAESAAKAFDDGLAEGRLPYQAMKALRSVIGKKLADPMLVDDMPRADLKQMYGSLTDDMRSAMPTKEAQAAFDRANNYYSAGLDRIETTLQKVTDANYPERAFQFAMSGAKDGGSKLWQLRRSLTPDEWGMVSSRVMRDLGTATPGTQSAQGDLFSPATFLTNWNKLDPQAKAALFGGGNNTDLIPNLDRLARVSGAIKDSAAMANPSGTAGQSAFMNVLLGGSSGAGAGYALNGEEGAKTGAAVGVVAPYAAAKLLTSPRFVDWLVRASRIEPTNVTGAASHLSRLVPIATGADPETRQAILSYYRALTPSIAPMPTAATAESGKEANP